MNGRPRRGKGRDKTTTEIELATYPSGLREESAKLRFSGSNPLVASSFAAEFGAGAYK